MIIEVKLIEAVRKHRVLYDTRHSDYMKINLKRKIWCDIANELMLNDGDEAKNIWLRLRGSFRDALRRQQRYLKNGVRSRQFKSWRFQKRMSFLIPYMYTEPLRKSIVEDGDGHQHVSEPSGSREEGSSVLDNGTWLELEPGEHAEDIFEEVSDIDQLLIKEEVLEDSAEELSRVTYVPTSNPPITNANGKKSEESRVLPKRTPPAVEETKNAEDPLFNFFISMYQITKTMPHLHQHRIRAQIFQIVSDTEAEIMNFNESALSRTADAEESGVSVLEDQIDSKSENIPSDTI